MKTQHLAKFNKLRFDSLQNDFIKPLRERQGLFFQRFEQGYSQRIRVCERLP